MSKHNKIKQEMNEIEIPEELSERSKTGVYQAKKEMKKDKKVFNVKGIGIAAALIVSIGAFILFNNGVPDSITSNPNNGESENEVQTETSASWAYPFVKWENESYVVTKEEVKEDKISQEIGEVTSYSDLESSDTSGNFSNEYEVGTKYYEIIEVSKKEAIAVEDQKGKFIKAVISDKWEEENF